MNSLFEGIELPWDWKLELAGRERRAAQPGWMLKLDKALPDVATYETSDVTVDAKNMTATAVISTPRLDQSRDIILGLGIDTEIHRRNPLVLLMHQPTNPIGRAEDVYGGYTVRTGDERTVATTHFFKGSKESEQVFRLVEMKALPGASVGIRPKARMVKQKSDNEGRSFCIIEGCHLVEYSHVFFPDNPECLIVAVQKGLGGKPLVPSLKEMFMSVLPVTNPIVQGATLPVDFIEDLKTKAAAGETLTPVQSDILKASPKVQACVSRKIPIIHSDHPEWKMDQVEAAAYSMCGEKKKEASEGGEHYEEDKRPLGAQYMAAMHEMVVAMQEFMDDNESRLEPEVAKELSGLHEHHANMMKYISEQYSKRYPELPTLMHKMEHDEPDMDEDDPEKKHNAMLMMYRKMARAAVREFWLERQKKLKSTDHEIVAEASRFLTEIAAGSGVMPRHSKAAALLHAKNLKEIKQKILVQEEKPQETQWESIAAKLEERKKLLKVD